MPTYDYHCVDCEKDFFVIQHISELGTSQPECPECKSTNVERVFGNVMVKTKKKS